MSTRALRARGDRELHLVAVAVDLLGAQDRPDLDALKPPHPLEHVGNLLGLERELGGVAHVLEPAPAAPAEVGAGRLHAVGRRRLDLLDEAAPEARPGLVETDPHPIAGHPAGDEDHIPVGATHTFAPECQVVDGQGQAFPSLGPGHGPATINVGQNGVNLPPGFAGGSGGGPSVMMNGTMARALASRPLRVRDLLVAAVPGLRDRMLEETIRSGWAEIAGPEIARRSRPGSFARASSPSSSTIPPGSRR